MKVPPRIFSVVKNQGILCTRSVFIPLFCVIAVLFLNSCVGDPKVWDDTIAEEDLATIFFGPGIKIKEYNGIYVKKFEYAKIPAGQTAIVLDIDYHTQVIRYIGTDAIFRFNYEKGKEYVMLFSQDENRKYGVKIYEGRIYKYTYPPIETLVAFVPFENQK
jgi:hypothetical protein